jgi:ABC-type polysaccharide/polyol phosphate transport system ATPase subunit
MSSFAGLVETAIELSEVFVQYSPAVMGRRALFEKLLKRAVDRFTALAEVSVKVRRGTGLALIGDNGAGKSTLLRVIAGTVPTTRGTVRVRGEVTTLLDLGAGLEDALSGWENIELAAALQRLPYAQTRAFRDYVVWFSQLGEALSRPVRSYSAGMRLRLMFSLRTFVQPEILVVDEIFSVGDLAFSEKARARTRELLTAASALVFATHDMPLAEEFCDQAAWLDRGRLKVLGPTRGTVELYCASRSAKMMKHSRAA